jgi:hypothetical protein
MSKGDKKQKLISKLRLQQQATAVSLQQACNNRTMHFKD